MPGRPRRDPDDDADNRPRPRRKRPGSRRKAKGGPPVGLIIGLVAGALVLAGAAVAGALWLRAERAGGGGGPAADNPAVTRDNWKRVQAGMTPAQVEQVFGPGQSVPWTEVLRAIRATGSPGRTDTLVLKWRNGPDTALAGPLDEAQGFRESSR